MKTVLKIGVRQLIEFVYRTGDLDLRFQGRGKMNEGLRVHQSVQKSQGIDYIPEYPLSGTFYYADGFREIELIVSGRADGVLLTQDGYVIDEIKGTSLFLENIDCDTFPLHWAQAKMYGALLCTEKNLEELMLQLTYVSFADDSVKRFKVSYTRHALISFLEETLSRYEKWLMYRVGWEAKRDESCRQMVFPYPQYRFGQRELAVGVYHAIKDNKRLFVQAPTGIGKTLSTLFPAMKSFGDQGTNRIFYLSAKAVTKGVAEESLDKLRRENQELSIKSMTLSAKEKICLNEELACYPEKCVYAKGHYDRTLEALWDVIHHEQAFTLEVIQKYAQKHMLCPYEFSLDLSQMSDVIICDYNYVFDPRVYLRRFFEVPNEAYVFLVDEAHNLISRARDMYSTELKRSDLRALKKKIPPKDKVLKRALEAVDKVMLSERKVCDDSGIWVQEDMSEQLMYQIKNRIPKFEKWLTENSGSDVYEDALDLYFQWVSYLRIAEIYNEGYVSMVYNGNTVDTVFKLFCIHPAKAMMRFIENAVAIVFFSATLSPIQYYMNMLTQNEQSRNMTLPSPFEVDHRVLMYATDVSVTYRNRGRSLGRVCDYIEKMASAKKGNYMAFFPSYKYMEEAYWCFSQAYGSRFKTVLQDRFLTDVEKNSFLDAFNDTDQEQSMVCFVVMGSHFSEGIDLVGEKLVGAAVVGVGLPMVDLENQIIQHYFDSRGSDGFALAYQCPGVNKVMQSAGRVIRDEQDRGVILLIDERYAQKHYKKYFPEDWGDVYTTIDGIEKQLEEFWKREE